MGSNYRKGRRYEYELRKRLEGNGENIVLRTAGSHGFCDLVVIKRNGEIEFWQVSKRRERKKLEELRRIKECFKIKIFYYVVDKKEVIEL